MIMNTFEHGYSDAVHGRQCVLGAPDYKAGYEHGSRYRRNQKAIELTVLGILAVTIGVVLALMVADVAGGMPV